MSKRKTKRYKNINKPKMEYKNLAGVFLSRLKHVGFLPKLS